MTISSTTRKAGPFTGNDVTTVFPFAFKVFASSELSVVKALTATGAETVLVENSDYTVSLNADQDASPGGSVTLTAALATGYKMVITSDIANLQAIDFTNMGGFFPSTLNLGLDKLTILVQQLTDSVSRAIKFSVTSPSDELSEIPSSARESKLIGFDAVGVLTLYAVQVGTSLVDLAASAGSSLIGFIQAGTGAVTRTLQGKCRDTVSVKDFGAIGNGVADDTTAILAAVTYCKTSGAALFWPAGVYLLSSSITTDRQLEMYGVGFDGGGAESTFSKVVYSGSDYAFKVNGTIGTYQRSGIIVSGMAFEGTSAALGCFKTNNGTGNVAASRVDNFRLIGVSITGFQNGIGVYLSNTYVNAFENLFISGCAVGFQGYYSHANVFNGGSIQYCNLGMNLITCAGTTLNGTTIQSMVNATFPTNADVKGIEGGATLNVGHASMNTVAGTGIRCWASQVEWNGGYVELIDTAVFSLRSTDDAVDMHGVFVTLAGAESLVETWYSRFNVAGNNIVLGGSYTGLVLNYPGTGPGGVGEVGVGTGFYFAGNLGEIPAANIHSHFKANSNKTYAEASVLETSNRTEFGRTAMANYGAAEFYGNVTIPTGYNFVNPLEVGTNHGVIARINAAWTNKNVLSTNFTSSDYTEITVPSSAANSASIKLWNSGLGEIAGIWQPSADNTHTLGSASFRWSVVYAGNGTINTSDANQKQQIRPLTDVEKLVAASIKPLVRAFKFNDAVARKGSAARLHVGVIAQDVKAAFEAQGLNGFDYGILCFDELPEQLEERNLEGEIVREYRAAGSIYGVRYEELLAFMIAAL